MVTLDVEYIGSLLRETLCATVTVSAYTVSAAVLTLLMGIQRENEWYLLVLREVLSES